MSSDDGELLVGLHRDFIARCAMSGFLWALGDVLAQFIERSPVSTRVLMRLRDCSFENLVDAVWWPRAMKMALFATFLFAPTTITWFSILEETFPGQSIGASLAKATCDQILYSPVAIMAVFVFVSLTDGASVSVALSNGIRKLKPALFMNWRIWPFVQFFNMALVPLEYRIVIVSLISVPWSAYLAAQANLPPNSSSQTTGYQQLATTEHQDGPYSQHEGSLDHDDSLLDDFSSELNEFESQQLDSSI